MHHPSGAILRYSTPSIVTVVADVIVNAIAEPFFDENPFALLPSSAGQPFGRQVEANDTLNVASVTV